MLRFRGAKTDGYSVYYFSEQSREGEVWKLEDAAGEGGAGWDGRE